MSSRAARGRPKIFKGKDGYYHCTVEIGIDPLTGKRERAHVSRATKAKVQAKVAELERLKADGIRARDTSTVAGWFRAWLQGVEGSDRRASTFRSYESHFRCYIEPRLGRVKLSDLTVEQVEGMLRWMVSPAGPGLSASTADSVRRTMRTALNTAIKRGYLVRNVAALADSPHGPSNSVPTIHPDDIGPILTTLQTHPGRGRYLLSLTTGMRQGEVLGLKRSAIDLENLSISVRRSLSRGKWKHGCPDPVACAARHCRTTPCPDPCKKHSRPCPAPCHDECTEHARVCPNRTGGGLILEKTKTEKVRTVPLHPALAEILQEHLRQSKIAHLAHGTPWDRDGYVFCWPQDGRPLNPAWDWKVWSQLLADSDVPHYRLHSARHYATTTALANGVDQRMVMELLGWSTVAMVARYGHVMDDNRREAAAKMSAGIFAVSNESTQKAADQ